MTTDAARKRRSSLSIPDVGGGEIGQGKEPHPRGEAKHGGFVQLLRLLLFTSWFMATAVSVVTTQLIGAPLYWINQDYYYAYMALTKQSFGIHITAITEWFSPTTMRVSWDDGLQGQFKLRSDGKLDTRFPERLIFMANHQIYTDWLYQWWIAYTSQMHGHVYIILREDLKYIPILGIGMMFYGFIFMSRKWAADKPRMLHRLGKLKSRHSGPMSGSQGLDPMWLMIFPEGTNLSANQRNKSRAFAEKQGIKDMKHQILPRSTGLLFCLEQLKGTVEWVYDCTVAYEGTPRDGYAEDYFTLGSTYFQGRPPASVSMHWRRFAISSIPIESPKEFEAWLMARWREKDALLEEYHATGSFPAAKSTKNCLETQVKLRSQLEIVQIFMVLVTLALLLNVMEKLYKMFF